MVVTVINMIRVMTKKMMILMFMAMSGFLQREQHEACADGGDGDRYNQGNDEKDVEQREQQEACADVSF